MPTALALQRRGLRPDPKIWNAGRRLALYTDGLLNSVTDGSYSMTVNLANKAGNVSYSAANDKMVGVAAVLATPTAQNGALVFVLPADMNMGAFDYIVFSAKADTAALVWGLRLFDNAFASAGGAINFTPPTNGWQRFRYHLRNDATSFGAASLTTTTSLVKNVAFIENNGVYSAAPMEIDEVMLVKLRTDMRYLSPFHRPTRLLGDEIRAYQTVENHWPLVQGAQGAPGADPFGNGYWAAYYVPCVDGNFAGTTEEILEWGLRKWGFVAGSIPETVRRGYVSRLPYPAYAGLTLDYPDFSKAQAEKEGQWRMGMRSDWRTISRDGANKGYTSVGIKQVNENDFGGYPGTRENTAYNLDMSLALLRAHFDGSSHLATSAPFPINSASTTDQRFRRSVQAYFWGYNAAEDNTSSSETGSYVCEILGGTSYLSVNWGTGKIGAKNWIADATTRNKVDYPG